MREMMGEEKEEEISGKNKKRNNQDNMSLYAKASPSKQTNTVPSS